MNLNGAHHAELLRRFVLRLRGALNLPSDSCFPVDEPRSVPAPSLPDKAYMVSFEGASFNSDGDQCRELLISNAYIDVTCFNRLRASDESSRRNSFISTFDTNLFEMQRRVMLALVGWRFELDGADDLQIASTVKATRSAKPMILEADSGVFGAFLTTTFSVAVAIDLCNQDYNV